MPTDSKLQLLHPGSLSQL